MTRPRLTPKRVEGLQEVWSLAYHDVQGETERWPPEHPVHTGLQYLRELRDWYDNRKSER